MECDRNLCYTALQNDLSCEECEAMHSSKYYYDHERRTGMKLIARTKLNNGETAYASDPQKLYEVKEKLYRYERVADEPEKVVAIDRVLEFIDKLYDTTCDRYSKVGYMESARNELRMCRQAVLTLKGGEQE